jgi:predicted TIM-barrel fold metal-dependent hydrolase
MDAAGIDVQILSQAAPDVATTEFVEPSVATSLATQANDAAAAAIAAYPEAPRSRSI